MLLEAFDLSVPARERMEEFASLAAVADPFQGVREPPVDGIQAAGEVLRLLLETTCGEQIAARPARYPRKDSGRYHHAHSAPGSIRTLHPCSL